MASINLKGKNMLRSLKLLLALITLLMAGTLLAQSPKVEEPLDLASFHEEFDKVDCKDCHGVPEAIVMGPEASLRMANQKCMDCHGTTANVAAKIRPKLANKHINPHAGHVVSIECVTCHISHDPSAAYCTQCHAFDMPMQVGKRYKTK